MPPLPGRVLARRLPRTVAQAEALDAMLAAQGVILDAVLSYDLPLDEIVNRLGGRRTCAGCKAVYHIVTRKPEVEGVCDRCRGQLIQRDDDREEAIRVRMHAYEESTRPLADYYERTGKIAVIPATGSPAEILDRSLRALGEREAPVQA